MYTIAQDHRGRYWIASNAGLAYFDGYQFTYLTSENGVKNVDLIALQFFNKNLYTLTINKLEIIDIKNLDSKLSTQKYNFNILNYFGAEFNNGIYTVRYFDSSESYYGLYLINKQLIKFPYYNPINKKFESLLNKRNGSYGHTSNPNIFMAFDSFFELKKDNSLNPLLKLKVAVPTSSYKLDSIFFIGKINSSNSFDIHHKQLNKTKSLFGNMNTLSLDLYQNNGFFLTTYKNGIFLYTLKNYQKKNLSNFNYNSFYRTANLLNEQTNLEFDPAIKKTGQQYQFYHGQKWIPYSGGIKSLVKLDYENFIIGRRDGTSFFHIKDDQTLIPKNIDNS